jgi:hypothetical protein
MHILENRLLTAPIVVFLILSKIMKILRQEEIRNARPSIVGIIRFQIYL